MKRMIANAFRILVLCLMIPAASGTAQSLQRLSLQGSGALVFGTRSDPVFENRTRLGYEAQLRYTPNRLSVGAGYQRSTVYSLRADGVDFSAALSLAFLEPRYVAVAGNRAAGYLAGRLGYGTLVCSEACSSDSYLSYGGGGGILILLTRRSAIDLGGQYFATNDAATSGYLLLRLGLSVGL